MGNILDLFKSVCAAQPGKIALVHHLPGGRSEKISFGELNVISGRIADYLVSRGVSSGDFVGVFCNKSIENIATIMGIMKIGAIFYTIHHRSRLPQVNHILEITRSKFLFVDTTSLLNFKNIDEFKPGKTILIFFANNKMGPVHQGIIKSLANSADIVFFPLMQHRLASDGNCPVIIKQDPCLVLFTSGSTGRPNGVMISHQDLYNRVMTECCDFSLSSNDRLLSLLPFSFDVGCNQLFSSLATGCKLVILNSWLPKDICTAVHKHSITGISAVPAIWSRLLELSDHELVRTAFKSVRYITVSGGDLPVPRLRQLQQMLPHVGIFKTYGQTETFRSSILKPHDFREKTASVGQAVAGTHVFILNSKGGVAEIDEPGEIIHCGDGMMMGYIGDRKRTLKKIRRNPLQNPSAPFRQYVVYTGDVGKKDRDGYFYVLGRKDKMIKTSGFRVYPQEVANQIMTHPSVKDAVVFGIKDTTGDSRIFSEIQLKHGAVLSEEELKLYLANCLPDYMIPCRLIFVDNFPRTPSGKIKLSEIEAKYHHA